MDIQKLFSPKVSTASSRAEGQATRSYRYLNRFTVSLVLFCLTLPIAQLSSAKDVQAKADRPISNPPNVLTHRDGISTKALASAAVDQIPDAGEVLINLDVKITPGAIFNPATGLFDKVALRAYQGGNNDPDAPFVAPTITIIPGDTVRVNLNNQLDPNDPTCKDVSEVNTPHCFNSTNLHSHGLWISPAGNSDNVLIKVDPGVNFTYEWNIPVDHPAGTFWYHPHLHGSTALQVASGMAGAIIIKNNRMPSVEKNGDIDTLLRKTDGSSYTDRLVLFEQIQYACRDANGTIKTDANGKWICNPGDVGEVDSYDQFGPGTWKSSGRYTSVNGRVMPTFISTAGDIERWRMVHAGVRETIKPSFRKAVGASASKVSASGFAAASEDEKLTFIDQFCNGPQATQLSLAIDGLTRNKLAEQKVGTLQPGYREDLLMVFPEPGVYCIIDEAASKGTVGGVSESREILGFVKVESGHQGIPNVVEYVRENLVASAKKFMPASTRKSIIEDLQTNLGLEHFIPHQSISKAEVTGKQSLAFNISTNGKTRFEVGNLKSDGLPTNLNSYDPGRVDRNLVLGGVDEWTLKSFFNEKVDNVGHPFHIHVNPFQIISIKDKDGNEVSGYEPDNTSQYARLQGVWKDTLFIDSEDHTIVMRTRYQRYIGEFVLHCHILDHEDQGMMQNVKISLPGSNGQPTSAHMTH